MKDIEKLVGLWYGTLVDHHKDRDCHFSIVTRWSYGRPATFFVEHHGYILEQLYEEFPTYREAAVWLREYLIEKIRDEIKGWNTATPDSWAFSQEDIERNREQMAKIEIELNKIAPKRKRPL